MRFVTGFLAVAICVPAAETPDQILARLRHQMADNLARLPNYTCLETIERRAGPAGSKHLPLVDRLRLEVAYVSRGELYSWPGAGQFEEKSLGEIVGPGAAIDTGSFALHARAVFDSDAPIFSFVGESERNGRKTLKFDFRISKEKSRYAIQTVALPVVVGYHGFIEADASTLSLLRLELGADEIPPELKVRSAGTAIQYQQMRIGDSDFLLPISSELTMVQATGEESRNTTQFEKCRQYTGESTLKFDVPDSGASAGQTTTPIALPAGLMIEVLLREGIDRNNAARGDSVHATVTSDLKKPGVVIIPKGAILTGRLTRIVSRSQRTLGYVGVGLLFQTIEFNGRRGTFSGVLEEAGTGQNYSIARNPIPGETLFYFKTPTERVPARTRLLLRTN